MGDDLRDAISQLLDRPVLTHFDRGELAELYVAVEFGLELAANRVAKGHDCIDPSTGELWEVKYRAVGTQHIDANHVDGFAQMVLVNMGADGGNPAFWVLGQGRLHEVFTYREGHGKWQARQDKFKRFARLHRASRI